jgi:hypothetical protein
MTIPFQYPPLPHSRRHGPQGYADYSRFLPWLRDEFSFRCVYCLLRERWETGTAFFHIDHFKPAPHRPDLVTDYDNLLYACVKCNLAKGIRLLPDPLSVLTIAVVRVELDGTIHADGNSDAARLIELLGLNSPEYTRFRKLWIDIVALARQDVDLCQRLLGYPANLPDLRRQRPPHGNTRPAGVEQSAFAQRKRGELPSYY